MADRLQVLVLEQNTDDIAIIARELQQAGFDFACTHADSERTYRSSLECPPDIILANTNLPGFNARNVIEVLNERGAEVPVIVLSTKGNEGSAIEALRHGATDYVLKDRLGRLGCAIENALEQKRLRCEKRLDDAQLLLQERAINAVTQGIAICDARCSGRPIIFVNPGFERMTGYTQREALGRGFQILFGERTDRQVVAQFDQALNERQPISIEILSYRKDGVPFWNALAVSPIHDEEGSVTHFAVVQTDISERKRLEDQYRQAQKMEAVGRLAGGIAHDFNNLLTVILGCSDLALSAMSADAPFRDHLQQIKLAGDRGTSLIRQLLAFSRKQNLEPRLLYLNEVICDIEGMLRRLISEDIDFSTVLDPSLGMVKADASQLEQVILNLVVNARDAMPQGGQIIIETHNVVLDDDFVRVRPEVVPGPYVLMLARDTGCGMTPEVMAHMFEPFYTTKEGGKGTGLGLATVYGIVKQSNGHIHAESQPGRGTTFYVYLPRVLSTEICPSQFASPLVFPGGKETILLVEDEEAVRRLNRLVLESKGYQVLEAADGEAATRICAEYTGSIHLVITDVIMPKMSCRELTDQIAALKPAARILYVSGYSSDVITAQGIDAPENSLLQKPFQPVSLLKKVREMLK